MPTTEEAAIAIGRPVPNRPYDVERAFRGSALSPAPEEEWLDLGANPEGNFEVTEAHPCQIEEQTLCYAT